MNFYLAWFWANGQSSMIGQPEIPKLFQQTDYAIAFVFENMSKAITKILSKQEHIYFTHTKTPKLNSLSNRPLLNILLKAV